MPDVRALPATRSLLHIDGADIGYFSVRDAFPDAFDALPMSLRVLAENVLRKEPDPERRARSLDAIATRAADVDLPFRPERVVLQDMLGTAVLTDLAALRDEVVEGGGEPEDVNPALTTHLVVDHSLNVDAWGTDGARTENERIEQDRNAERFRFMKWASTAFANLSIIGSGSGILHQINIERLTPVIDLVETPDGPLAVPDTLVGTDSHTPMINAIGVLGWGVGGLEAEVAMLGKPLMMRLPEIVGVRLDGALPAGILATDLALSLAERLRAVGVVGAILEFHGPGLQSLSLPDRATVANMAPEYGATAALFPIDERTIEYMRITGRDAQQRGLTEEFAKAQGLWATSLAGARYDRVTSFDLSSVERVIAGPRQPHERIPIRSGAPILSTNDNSGLPQRPVVIAAITSCTNTSNPRTIITAALLARNARRLGLKIPSWVRTSFAPGSRAVSEYLRASGLQDSLDDLGFNIIGFGCTTCNGLSGPLLPADLMSEIERAGATPVGVTSGNRNFEGRVHPQAREVFIMSPPLVLAYALAGSFDQDIARIPLGHTSEGGPITLQDIWPGDVEVGKVENEFATSAAFERGYREVDLVLADARRRFQSRSLGTQFGWDEKSTYVRRPPYWGLPSNARPGRMEGLRPLVILGDHITTDHISPTGTILPHSATGKYLFENGVEFADFNSYGSRRGNFEAAQRATFASPRLRNEMLADGAEGPITLLEPDHCRTTVYEAAQQYAKRGVGLVVIAGKNYGSGSSRDWAAKGPRLLGVRVVIAESFERIHRQNLAAVGTLPLEFAEGHDRRSLGLSGSSVIDVVGVDDRMAPRQRVMVRAHREDGSVVEFPTISRLDTSEDVAYFGAGGILAQLKTEILSSQPGAPAKLEAAQ